MKTALANLQNKFSQYKSSVETRRISPSPGPRSPKPEVQPVTRKRAATLEARTYHEVTSPKRKATVSKLTSPPTSPLRKAEEAKPQSPVTSPSHRSQEGPFLPGNHTLENGLKKALPVHLRNFMRCFGNAPSLVLLEGLGRSHYPLLATLRGPQDTSCSLPAPRASS